MTERDNEPDYYAIISREAVEEAARRTDALGALALRMLSDKDERQVFREGARLHLENRSKETAVRHCGPCRNVWSQRPNRSEAAPAVLGNCE